MIIYLQMLETEEEKSKFEQLYTQYRGLMYRIADSKVQHFSKLL